MKFQAVLFDMDGVLVNSEPHYWAEERKFYQSLGAPLSDEQMQEMMGASPASNTRRVLDWFPNVKIEHAQLIRMHEEMLLRGLKHVDSLVAGAEDWIMRIRASGMKTAVASSSPAPLLDYARERFGFSRLFDTVVCSRDVANAKPAPDIFLEAARRLEAEPALCLVVEDSQNGVNAARAAGMKVAAFTGALAGAPATGADWVVPKFDDAWYRQIFGEAAACQ